MANTALARFTAGVTFIAGQLATFTDFRRFQNAIRQNTMEALFGRLFLNGTTLRNGFFGDDCLVTSSGGLNYSVAPGLGFFYDATITDEFTAQYRPIVVPSAITGTLDAHDATNPRIDIICLAPAFTTDVSESITVRASDGSLTTPTADRRSLYYRAIQVVAGTPAGSPSAPAVPTGYLRLCECAVPAVSGDIVVTDSRALMVLSQGALGLLSIATANIQGSAVTAAKIANGAVTPTRLSVRPVFPRLSIGSETSNAFTVTIQVADIDEVNVAGEFTIYLWLRNRTLGLIGATGDYKIEIGGFGAEYAGAHDGVDADTPCMVLTTNVGSGLAEVDVTDLVTGANRGVQLFAQIMDKWGHTSMIDLPFN